MHEIDPIKVVVVAPLASDSGARELVAKLRVDLLGVELASADVLRAPAEPAVYVFLFDAAIAIAMADRVVTWAAACERAGIVAACHHGDAPEREALLAAGFDDVVTGSLSPRELAGRVRATHRRLHRRPADTGRVRHAAFTIDLDQHELWADGVRIALTPAELAVMRELVRARGKPLSRTQLLDAAWGEGEIEITERAVDNVVLRLRRKLPRPDALETVRGVGFRLG